jgi:hypothetical protein
VKIGMGLNAMVYDTKITIILPKSTQDLYLWVYHVANHEFTFKAVENQKFWRRRN